MNTHNWKKKKIVRGVLPGATVLDFNIPEFIQCLIPKAIPKKPVPQFQMISEKGKESKITRYYGHIMSNNAERGDLL